MTSSLEIIAAALSRKTQYGWLKPIVDNIDVNAKLLSIVKDTLSELKDHFAFDPHQYDTFIDAHSQRLDRCLTYRREFYDLASSAIRQCLEYEQFEAQRENLEKLEKSPWTVDSNSTNAKRQADVAKKFESEPHAPLGAGFASVARASKAVSESNITGETDRQKLVEARWKELVKYQSQLNLRHEMDGHPLNYGQRALAVLSLLLDDFLVCVREAVSLSAGIKLIYGMSFPEDWRKRKEGHSPLDDLVKWARQVINALSVAYDREQEIVFESHISYKSWPNQWHQLVQVGLTAHLDKPKRPHEFIKGLRLRSVGVGIASAHHVPFERRALLDFSAILKVSPGEFTFIDGIKYGSPAHYVTGYPIHNRLPFKRDAELGHRFVTDWMVYLHQRTDIVPEPIKDPIGFVFYFVFRGQYIG